MQEALFITKRGGISSFLGKGLLLDAKGPHVGPVSFMKGYCTIGERAYFLNHLNAS